MLPRSAHHILPWPRHASTAPPRLLETRADCVCQDENPFSSLLINYEKLNNQVAGNREVQGEFTAPLVEATLPLEAMGPNMAGAGDTDSPSWSLGMMVRKATLPSTFWFPVPVLYLLGTQPWRRGVCSVSWRIIPHSCRVLAPVGNPGYVSKRLSPPLMGGQLPGGVIWIETVGLLVMCLLHPHCNKVGPLPWNRLAWNPLWVKGGAGIGPAGRKGSPMPRRLDDPTQDPFLSLPNGLPRADH